VRKLLITLLSSALAAAAAASATGQARPLASCPTLESAQLTIGTDNPAYPPWFGGSPPKGSKWKVSDPESGKGFESAVAYAVARQLGFKPGKVQWTYVPFTRSFAPGPKSFDFDINQISYSPARARVVTFSDSYYQVNQSVVVLDGTKIAKVRTLAGLRPYKLGAQLGTTSYSYIKDHIEPSTQPAVYQTNAAAIQALKNKQIDGLVVDLPTAFYVTAAQVENSKVLGQFPSEPGGEHFGMVFARGNPLARCVDSALSRLKANGTLARIQQTWLAKATGAPVLK
jgi:polar amino acid transport system substrate-binding protein